MKFSKGKAQNGLFDLIERHEEIDFEFFRPRLLEILYYGDHEKGVRPPWDLVLMLKTEVDEHNPVPCRESSEITNPTVPLINMKILTATLFLLTASIAQVRRAMTRTRKTRTKNLIAVVVFLSALPCLTVGQHALSSGELETRLTYRLLLLDEFLTARLKLLKREELEQAGLLEFPRVPTDLLKKLNVNLIDRMGADLLKWLAADLMKWQETDLTDPDSVEWQEIGLTDHLKFLERIDELNYRLQLLDVYLKDRKERMNVLRMFGPDLLDEFLVERILQLAYLENRLGADLIKRVDAKKINTREVDADLLKEVRLKLDRLKVEEQKKNKRLQTK